MALELRVLLHHGQLVGDDLPIHVEHAVHIHFLKANHAAKLVALLAIDDKDEQYNLANRIFDEKLSVRDTEKLVKEIKNPKKPKEKVKTVNDFIYKDLANKMKEVMGTKVSIASKGNGKGKIEIEYYSDEELERMFDMIMSIGKEE